MNISRIYRKRIIPKDLIPLDDDIIVAQDEETLIHVVRTGEVPALVEEGVISGGMIPKMQCCVDAICGGVERVHILDGRIPHSILVELLSDEGIGTMMKQEDTI